MDAARVCGRLAVEDRGEHADAGRENQGGEAVLRLVNTAVAPRQTLDKPVGASFQDGYLFSGLVIVVVCGLREVHTSVRTRGASLTDIHVPAWGKTTCAYVFN